MPVTLQDNAQTTPTNRHARQTATEPTEILAEPYPFHPATVREWRSRSCATDGSHRPHPLETRLSPDPETLVLELHQPTRFLPLDDRLAVTRAFIQPQV